MKFTPSRGVFFLSSLIITSFAYARPLEERTWELNAGPLFNFARYNFDNNVDCCSPCKPVKKTCEPCCEFPDPQGYLAGIHFDVVHSRPSNYFFLMDFDGRWNAGHVNNTLGTFLQVRDYRTQSKFGYNFFRRNDSFVVTPFFGLGFYFLSTEFKHEILTNKYYNLFVPVGFDLLWDVRPECFNVGLSATYRIDAWTRLRVTTDGGEQCPHGKCPDLCSCKDSCDKKCKDECDPCDGRLELNKRAHGVHVELPMTWYPKHGERATFQTTVTPFFDWNRFGGTCETNCNGVRIPVPKLDRWYLGLHIDLGLRF